MELVGVNAYTSSAVCDVLELNLALNQCEQGIILTAAYVHTGMDVSASLADDDVAGDYVLTVSSLNTKSLGLAVTTVLGRTYTFFMSKKLQTDANHGNILR
jgi:hypothetical protein